MQKSEKLSR